MKKKIENNEGKPPEQLGVMSHLGHKDSTKNSIRPFGEEDFQRVKNFLFPPKKTPNLSLVSSCPDVLSQDQQEGDDSPSDISDQTPLGSIIHFPLERLLKQKS